MFQERVTLRPREQKPRAKHLKLHEGNVSNWNASVCKSHVKRAREILETLSDRR